jgi:hypothetical protein
VEHPCYRCGAHIEEGVAFCPNCNAPQIRVASTENAPATPPLRPGTPDEMQPPAQPVDLQHRMASSEQQPYPPYHGERQPGTPEGIAWSDALPGTLAAGAIIALSWIVPFAGFLLWPIAAGVLATALYLRRRPNAVVTAGSGARLGAIAGLFGFAIFAILMAIDLLLMRGGGKLRQQMEQVIQQSAARNASPEAQAMMQRLLSPEGVAILITVVLVMFLLMFVVFGSIGGALGAKLLSRSNDRAGRSGQH